MEINDLYRLAQKEKNQCDVFLEAVKKNNMCWDGLDGRIYVDASQRLRLAESQCEQQAEHLLFSIDGIVSVLVREMTGRDKCLDIGEDVILGFSIDRILDAVGNYVRHRYEWKKGLAKKRDLRKQQLDSVRPLSTLIHGINDFSDEKSLDILMKSNLPMLATFDVLTDYEHNGELAEYSILHDRIVALCEKVIDVKFAEWYEVQYQCKE